MYSDIQEFSSNAVSDADQPREREPAGSVSAPNSESDASSRAEVEASQGPQGLDAESAEPAVEQPAEAGSVAPEVDASSLSIQMLGLAGEAIAGLNVRVVVDGASRDLQTDEQGSLPEVRALSGVKLEISVQRFDGSFKLIDSGLMPSGTSQWGFVSPKSVFEIETTPHDGEAGNAEESIPMPAPSDKGLEQGVAHELTHALPATVETQTPSQAKPPQPPAPPAKTAALAPAASTGAVEQSSRPQPSATAPSSRPQSPAICMASQPQRHVIPPKISGKTALPAPVLPRKSGRDTEGRPLLVVALQKVTDWWNNWRLPTSGIFGSRTSLRGVGSIADGKEKVFGTSAALPCAAAGAVAFDASMRDKVAALLQFAEEQTQYEYKPGTSAVLASLAKGAFKHKPGEKRPSSSLGMCYQYVKVALSRCEIVSGYVGDKSSVDVQESASKAGPALIQKGFVDVTEEVPDGRWAAAGDVIVYAWSDETWAERKKRKKQPDMPNHGHIDIRGVEEYVSDFIPETHHPQWVVPAPKQKNQGRANYVNVRIYRKIFDPLPVCRMRAFLACLREFECQQYKTDGERYTALQSALPANPKSRRFTSFETHPWDAVAADLRPTSTASGAYQIQRTTWEYVLNMGYFPELVGKPRFSPAVQDRIAVILIEQRKALHLIRGGRVTEAVQLLRNEWSSLPGASENAGRMSGRRPMDMNFLLELFQSNLSNELKKAGVA